MARLPSYNIPGIIAMRDRIAGDVGMIGYIGTQPSGADFDSFVRDVHRQLPPRISYDVVYDSCQYLLEQELTDTRLKQLFWRLAGNIRRLRSGHAALPWAGQAVREWVPVQVVAGEYGVTSRGKRGATLTMRVLAGQACPEPLTVFWTTAYCRMFAPRLGFSKWASEAYPLRDAMELVNLRYFVEVLDGTVELAFEHVAVPPSCRDWNRQWIKMRARAPGVFVCPQGYEEDVFCYQCPVGKEGCSAAVHPHTYVHEDCPCCGRVRFTDPADKAMCVDCRNYLLTHEKKALI